MESKYIINVARPEGTTYDGEVCYVHYFQIEKKGAIGSKMNNEISSLVSSLRNAFPTYKITVTAWEVFGTPFEV